MKKLILMFVLFAAVQGYNKPNIVFIFADDLDADEIRVTADNTNIWPTHSGADDRGYFNKSHDPNVLTPHIDSLASEGKLFTRFYVNSTVCTPSRYNLLTGRLATRGIELQDHFSAGTQATLGWRPAILREESNLAKELQALGYRTGIIGKWHNMPSGIGLPNRVSDDHKANATYEHTLLVNDSLQEHYSAHLAYLLNGFGWDVADRMEWGNSIVNLEWQCEGALEFIEQSHAAGEPFFLYCSLPVPHGQYSFSYNDISTYDIRVSSNGIIPHEDLPIGVLPTVDDVFARTDAAGVSRDYAMATRMDDYVGAVMDKLEALGLRNDTLVIYTSDHASRGKNSCYDGGAKVPMIASWPGQVIQESTSDSLIGSVDIASTLIEIAGGTPPADMAVDGRSFRTQLLGQAEPVDWRESLLIEAENSRGIVTRNWKYIANRVSPDVAQLMADNPPNLPNPVFWSGVDHHNYETEKMYPSYWDADQLYDLNADPYEQTNVFSDPLNNASLTLLQGELSGYIASLPHTFAEFGLSQTDPLEESTNIDFSDEAGYVSGELNGQLGWTAPSGVFSVNSSGTGTLTTNSSSWKKASYTLGLSGGNGTQFSFGAAFSFTESAMAPSSTKTLMRIDLTGTDDSKVSAMIKRSSTGKYRVNFYEDSGAMTNQSGIWLDASSLGASNQAGSSSDLLYLELSITKGETEADWRNGTVTLYNLTVDPGKTAPLHIIPIGSFDSSPAFHSSELTAVLNTADPIGSFISGLTYHSILLSTPPPPPPPPANLPNILMLCIDDMNDWVGFLDGHPQTKTPNMDSLAVLGANFINAHCSAPGCSPSRNSIMFGAEPTTTGLYPFYRLIDLDATDTAALNAFLPMPQFFRNNGYYTAGYSKVWHNPDKDYKPAEQWDVYFSYGDNSLNLVDDPKYYDPGNKRLRARPANNPAGDFRDRKTANAAVDILQQTHSKPFFLAVGFILPHTPFVTPVDNYDRFDFPIEAPPILAGDLTDVPLVGQANAQLYVDIPVKSDNAWEKIRRGYLASISFTDDNVGVVLDALSTSPYASNTIVVLWSDHGFHLGEKQSFSKFSLWEEATRSPFIIYDPRGRDANGHSISAPVSLVDLYRTLAELSGLTPPDYLDGISLLPWLDDPTLPKTTPAMTTWGRGNYTLRSSDWRYTRYHDGSEELYNNKADPNEWTNLAGNSNYSAQKAQLSAYLPTSEAPQVQSGIELYNVSDADLPNNRVDSYQNEAAEYQTLGLLPPLNGYQFSDWISTAGHAGAEAQPGADADGNGLENLIEYAVKVPAGGDIHNYLPNLVFEQAALSEYLALSFRRRLDAPDLRYVVEGNDNLSTTWNYLWDSNAPVDTYMQSTIYNADGTQTITIRYPDEMDEATNAFIRLRMVLE